MQLFSIVLQLMIPQMSSLSEWFVALFTRVEFLSSVSQHMSFQIPSLTEWLVAIGTNVQLFPVVLQLMSPQSSSFREWHLFIFKINKKWAVISKIASLYHIEKNCEMMLSPHLYWCQGFKRLKKKHKFSRNYIKSWLDRGKKNIFFSWAGRRAGLPRKSRVVNWDILISLTACHGHLA